MQFQKKIYEVQSSKIHKDLNFLLLSDLNYNPNMYEKSNILLDFLLNKISKMEFDYIIIPGNLIYDASCNIDDLKLINYFLKEIKNICNKKGKHMYVTLGENDYLSREHDYEIIDNPKYFEMLSNTLGNSLLLDNSISVDDNNVLISGTSFNGEYQYRLHKHDFSSAFKNSNDFIKYIKQLHLENSNSLNIIINNDAINSLQTSLLSRHPDYSKLDLIFTSPLYRSTAFYLLDKITFGNYFNYNFLSTLEYSQGAHEIDFDKYICIPNSGNIFKRNASLTEFHIKRLHPVNPKKLF